MVIINFDLLKFLGKELVVVYFKVISFLLHVVVKQGYEEIC